MPGNIKGDLSSATGAAFSEKPATFLESFMKSEIINLLRPVRSRLRLRSGLSWLAAGALTGGIVCLVLAIGRLGLGWQVGVLEMAAAVVGGMGLLGLVGMAMQRPWNESAAVVDSHYDLKDRTVTALQFADDADASPMRELQVQDATGHLQSVNATEVVPFKAPRQAAWAAGLIGIACASLMFTIAQSPASADVTDRQGIEDAADEIQAEVEEMEELAEESGIEELKDLVEELKVDLAELQEADTDARESLETISEMQQKMQEMMASMNIAGMDAQLSAVAEAMAGAEAFKSAADALEKQDLDKAAKELENVNPENMERTEARPTSEKLALTAAAAKKKGMSKMSETLEQMSLSVKKGDNKGTCENCKSLSQQIKKHSLCKSMCNMLTSKCNKLGECKKLCAGSCNKSGQGQCPGTGINLAKGQSNNKSNNSSKKAGSKTAGNIDGEKTRLDSQRQMANLTGQMGAEGDSEFETTTSQEAQEQATRKAQKAFAKYQKMSEAVLESEPIPLGHRQTIRKYFELIRPNGDEDQASDSASE